MDFARRKLIEQPLHADRVAGEAGVSRSTVLSWAGLDTPLRGYSTSMNGAGGGYSTSMKGAGGGCSTSMKGGEGETRGGRGGYSAGTAVCPRTAATTAATARSTLAARAAASSCSESWTKAVVPRTAPQ